MRQRKTPQRTCVGCRQVKAKKELVRIVRDQEGRLQVDSTGKAPGRGAYICPSSACLELAVKAKQLERALERPVSPELLTALKQRLEGAG